MFQVGLEQVLGCWDCMHQHCAWLVSCGIPEVFLVLVYQHWFRRYLLCSISYRDSNRQWSTWVAIHRLRATDLDSVRTVSSISHFFLLFFLEI